MLIYYYEKIFIEYYINLIKKQINVVQDMMNYIDIESNDNTLNTENPTCPWCGEIQLNYESFCFDKDTQRVCCKKNTDREYTIVRKLTKDNTVIYDTFKINKEN